MLHTAICDHPVEPPSAPDIPRGAKGTTVEHWREAVRRYSIDDKRPEKYRNQTFKRVGETLQSAGRIRIVNGYVWPAPEGQIQVKRSNLGQIGPDVTEPNAGNKGSNPGQRSHPPFRGCDLDLTVTGGPDSGSGRGSDPSIQGQEREGPAPQRPFTLTTKWKMLPGGLEPPEGAQVRTHPETGVREVRRPLVTARGSSAEPRPAPAVPDAFVPTAEWQEVLDGVVLPPGLEIRMDMNGGAKLARFMPRNEPEGEDVW
jgi:hypothetical protein